LSLSQGIKLRKKDVENMIKKIG